MPSPADKAGVVSQSQHSVLPDRTGQKGTLINSPLRAFLMSALSSSAQIGPYVKVANSLWLVVLAYVSITKPILVFLTTNICASSDVPHSSVNWLKKPEFFIS